MKSCKIHWNAWRCSSQILEGRSICPFDLHQLVEQCLVYYDDKTIVWLVFCPHAFTSTQPCSIIQIMCWCNYDKANTNTWHAMWLVSVVFFKYCPASLIVVFTLPLKKKAMFCTKVLATDPFSPTFMNCWLWFYYWFRRGFYPRSLQPEKKTLVSPVKPASRTSPAEPAWRLSLLMVSNSSVQHVAWEIFSRPDLNNLYQYCSM